MIKKKKKIRVRKAPKVSPDVTFSYKNTEMMSKFITEQGSILSREETGLSQKQQRELAREVKRARHLALLPFTQVL
jgi:small subunit ribosomal protein S18